MSDKNRETCGTAPISKTGKRVRRPLLLMTLCVSAAHAGSWPSFRGPGATGVADDQRPPIEWDVTKGHNVFWKTPIPGLGHSSPVVWDNRIFLTTAVSSDPNSIFKHGLDGSIDRRTDVSEHRWLALCLDKRTGRILWTREAARGTPKVQRHPKNSYASATPATDGKRVVVSFGSEGLYAYDFQGRLLWKQDMGVIDAGASYDPTYHWGTASSPILNKNLAIILCDQQKGSFLAAFDARTGKPVWRTDRDVISSFSTPSIIEGPSRAELVTNGPDWMHGYDPLSGKELWRLHGSSKNTTPTPFAAEGLIFLASGYRIRPIYELMATNPMGEALMATPAIVDNRIFIRGQHHLFAIGAIER